MSEVELPPESVLLDATYRRSGLTAADLSAATGISVGSVRIAITGVRYRDGLPKAVHPPDNTLAKLATVLGISPAAVEKAGRPRASEMMAEAVDAVVPADLDTKAAIAGRTALARQVLSVFSADELLAEIERRSRAEHEALDAEGQDDANDEWKASRGV